MWSCPQCAESIESEWEICWCCGTSRDGTVDPDFQRSVQRDDAPPAVRPSPTWPSQAFLVFSLALSAVIGAAYPFVFHRVPGGAFNAPAEMETSFGFAVLLFSIGSGPWLFWTVTFLNKLLSGSEPANNGFFDRYFFRFFYEPLACLRFGMWSNAMASTFTLFAHAVALEWPSLLVIGLWTTVPSIWLTIRYVESQRPVKPPHTSSVA